MSGVTGDPLDRIEQFWLRTSQGDPSRYTGALSEIAALMVKQSEDVLALVAVARAARPALAELDDAIKASVNGEWSQEDYDRWHAAREAGEAALARLDGAR